MPLKSHHNIVEFWDEKVRNRSFLMIRHDFLIENGGFGCKNLMKSHGKSPSNPMGYPSLISVPMKSHEFPKSYGIPATIYPSVAFPAAQGMVVALRMSELPISRNQAFLNKTSSRYQWHFCDADFAGLSAKSGYIYIIYIYIMYIYI